MSPKDPAAKSEFLKTATERGYIHQCTDWEALDSRLAAGVVTAYIGYDCTADSLHVGNLFGIMLLRLYQRSGHKPIVLIGGGTTKIRAFGDGPTDAIMVNNADWLDELRYIPLLRDVGRHFSVNRMLTQDSVRLRLERDQPLSFLEFNYT